MGWGAHSRALERGSARRGPGGCIDSPTRKRSPASLFRLLLHTQPSLSKHSLSQVRPGPGRAQRVRARGGLAARPRRGGEEAGGARLRDAGTKGVGEEGAVGTWLDEIGRAVARASHPSQPRCLFTLAAPSAGPLPSLLGRRRPDRVRRCVGPSSRASSTALRVRPLMHVTAPAASGAPLGRPAAAPGRQPRVIG